MSTYRVIYEMAADGSWSASAADLPVFSVGSTREEAEREIQQAIGVYLNELANRDRPTTVGAESGTVIV
jgi:predicted RNase H-like HicB family nuclease